MNYQETIQYLYDTVPMFQQIGGAAYKPGLYTTETLDAYLGHPHRNFKTIHVAGTNGKGSCSHTIAAVLQSAGYKTGLFTSPHLLDFRERIRINGEMIPEEYVIDFVEKHKSTFEPLHPSFFELTTAMAFAYFAAQKVDVAVIEVGMGGRLDCTNIIHPDLCVITSIAFDHMQYLGNTLEKIAGEKAGIIKPDVPVVTGPMPPEIVQLFRQKAQDMHAPFYAASPAHYETVLLSLQELKADESFNWVNTYNEDLHLSNTQSMLCIKSPQFPLGLYYELGGEYQIKNSATILAALNLLGTRGYRITQKDYYNGFAHVCQLTGLAGRWQHLHTAPDLICDTGHNEEAFKSLVHQLRQLRQTTYKHIHIVLGMVKDKDVKSVLRLLPTPQEGYVYYFTQASVRRALPADELQEMAHETGIEGKTYPTVPQAVKAAQQNSLPEDLIFVGGSNFIVADLLSNRNALHLD